MKLRYTLPLFALAACSSDDVVIGGLHEIAEMPAVANPDLDLLFVIDNSPSMGDNQRALAAAFPHLIAHLDQLDGGRPNLHLGVVTSDMGTSAAHGDPGPEVGTLGQGGCVGRGGDGQLIDASQALTDGGAFLYDLSDPSGARITNYEGTLDQQFARMAQVGDTGCGFEQPLAAMRRALTDQPGNAGFLRASANLAVVVVSDEDDCSALEPTLFAANADPALGPLDSYRCFREGAVCDEGTSTVGDKHHCRARDSSSYLASVASFRDALLALKPDPRQVMIAAITGDPTPVAVVQQPGFIPIDLAPSCVYSTVAGEDAGEAYPALRLASLVDGFPGGHTQTSICNPDLSGALDAVGATAKQLMGDPCLPTAQLVDTADADGLQPACEITLDSDGVEQPLPACGSAGGSCFRLIADPVACPDTPEHLRITYELQSTPAPGTVSHIKCQTKP